MAAATFLAFGSSAPEICINCVATYRNHVNMSVGAILGSGLIAFTVIPAASVFVSKGRTLELELGPLLRDVIFYVIAVLGFVFFAQASRTAPPPRLRHASATPPPRRRHASATPPPRRRHASATPLHPGGP